ncbi:MAG: ABC transporter ATP-binding protein [Polyangiaceae bacterium]
MAAQPIDFESNAMRNGAGTLSVRGVSKSYRLEGRVLPVLAGIDLEAPPGSFTAIVGASGCGKSTLLRLIVGLDADYDGAILLDGRPIREPGLERGIVFQEHRLFPWLTVADNIALGLSARAGSQDDKRKTVAEHIRLVGLEGFERAYPRQLSGGMAQRAAIARAIVSKPNILLLDEPFGALDALTRLHLQGELQRLWRAENVTMILVTHDIEEAVFLGQRVVVMDSRPGRIRKRLEVDLPYPRARAHPDFLHIKQDLLDEFHVGGEDGRRGAVPDRPAAVSGPRRP